MRKLVLGLTLLTALAACAGKPEFADPPLSDRQLNLEEFFDGTVTAHGQFQDIFGKVRRSFEVTIHGKWNGETLVLTEDFIYEDGSTEQRVWTLVKTGPDSWQGTAPGVIGTASGEENGDRFNWRYTIDLPIPSAEGETTYMRADFDDWMWLLSDDRLFNRAYLSRGGITLGDVSIMFEK